MNFPAQSPDLRRFPLVARASRLFARSPWSPAPPIRFLFVDSRFRYRFFQRRPRDRAGFAGFFALRFARGRCDQLPQRTSTSYPCPCWAHQSDQAGNPGLAAGLSILFIAYLSEGAHTSLRRLSTLRSLQFAYTAFWAPVVSLNEPSLLIESTVTASAESAPS